MLSGFLPALPAAALLQLASCRRLYLLYIDAHISRAGKPGLIYGVFN